MAYARLAKFIAPLVALLGLVGVAHAGPPLITLTGTVYNLDTSAASSTSGGGAARVTIRNLATQVISNTVLRKSQITLIANSSGQIPTSTYVQGEKATVQVDNSPPVSVTFPAQATVDLAALLNVATNTTTATVIPVTTSNGGTGCSSPATVANLPTCNSSHNLDICGVTNSLNTCVAGNSVVDGGTSGNACVVVCNGGTDTWQILETAAGAGFANPMTTLGDIMYENATPTAARLAGSTSSSLAVLTQTGTGSVSAAPSWSTTLPTSVLSGTTTGVVFAMGTLSNSEIVHLPAPISLTFPSTFSSSNTSASCSTNPSESDAYTLKSGGTSLATLTVSTSCALTFSTLAGSHVAAAGEKLELDAPATASGNVSISVQVTR